MSNFGRGLNSYFKPKGSTNATPSNVNNNEINTSEQGEDNKTFHLTTRGKNLLDESEFSGLGNLGIRAYNPSEIEANVVKQLESQISEKNGDKKEYPAPLQKYIDNSSFSDAVLESPLSSFVLEQMIQTKQRTIVEYSRRGRLDAVEDMKIKLQVLKYMLKKISGNDAKQEEEQQPQQVVENNDAKVETERERLVRTGKLAPTAKNKKAIKRVEIEEKTATSSSSVVSKKRKKSSEQEEGMVVGKRKSKRPKRKKIKDNKVECPLCFLRFDLSEIEPHTLSCNSGKQKVKRRSSTSSSQNVQDDHDLTEFTERVRRARYLDQIWKTLWQKAKVDGKTDEEADEIAKERMEEIEEDEEMIANFDFSSSESSSSSSSSSSSRSFSADEDDDALYFYLSGRLKFSRRFYVKLFEYQQTCMQWFWDLHKQGCGGILGDEMGLGKTVQVCSFLSALKHSKILKPTIICCPATTINQWVKELNRWAPELRVLVLHSSGSAIGNGIWTKNKVIQEITRHGDVLVSTYEGIRSSQEIVLNYRWGYVILDEGHKIRNPDADITLVCKQLHTVHRIVMSGSPIQNNLRELWSLFDFVSPGRLGTLPMFENQFAIPINAGGYSNASAMKVRMAYRCALVLKETIEPYLLRRLKKDVAQDLPQKIEQVLFCNLTKVQRDAYETFLKRPEIEEIILKSRSGGNKKTTFKFIRALQHICNHPDLFVQKMREEEEKKTIINSHNWKQYLAESDDDEDVGNDFIEPEQIDHDDFNDDEEEEDLGKKIVTTNLERLVSKSGKLMVLSVIMKKWKEQGHRVLLFSQGRLMLHILEQFVKLEGYTYLRMDGNTSIKSRASLINQFNDENSGIFVFLLTTKVGGLGINLTGADRVVLFDPDWNPSTDMQARERAWRVGQKKQVTIYRLITSGTIEEKMYHRQIFKQYLTNKILTDPRQRRFFKYSSMRDLFTLGDAGESSEEKAHERIERINSGRVSSSSSSRSSSSNSYTRRSNKRKSSRSLQEDLQTINEMEADEEDIKKDSEAATLTVEKALDKDMDAVAEHNVNKALANDTETGDIFQDATIDSSGQENNILQSLFDGGVGGFRQALSHDAVEDSARNNPDERILEQEAARVAQRAAAALRRDQVNAQRDRSNVHLPTWTGTNGVAGRGAIGGPSSAQLLDQLRQRNLNPNLEEANAMSGHVDESDPQFDLLKKLLLFLKTQSRSTQDILEQFREHPLSEDPSTFKMLLKQIANRSKGIWTLIDEFK